MPEEHTVTPGDCISTIAFAHGLPWDTLWNHPRNAALKRKRKNPNILGEGDTVYVPDLNAREEPRGTDQRHRFMLRGGPTRLRLRIVGPPPPRAGSRAKNEPLPDLPYVVDIEGKLQRGTTDGNGMIECTIPPNARDGRLVLEPGTAREFTIPLKLGQLEPVEETRGIQARLNNLGFHCGAVDGVLGPRTQRALRRFQSSVALHVTGEADDATRSRLRQAHDST
jgi:hypothetical protein